MPFKEFSDEYKKIKAPAELYGRIMNSESPAQAKSNVIQFRRLGTLAAALILVLIIGFVSTAGNGNTAVYLGNERLTGEVAVSGADTGSIMLARAGTEIVCDLKLELKRSTEVTPKDGFISGEDGSILAENEETAEFSGNISIKWTVPFAEEDKTYELELSDKKGAYSVKLYFDNTDLSWKANLVK